ncbi:MAG: PIG-L family deacetylase, partial [Microbacteriaceae bacterium]
MADFKGERVSAQSPSKRRRVSRLLLAFLTAGTMAGALLSSPTIAVAAPTAASVAGAVPDTGCTRGAMSIVAHTDDDLLFFNPDILHDIEAGRCTRTVFTTAGEAGNGEDYWSSLESGIEATYAQMAGVADVWRSTDSGVTAGAIKIHTLRDAPNVSVVFLRIPDGFDGSGSETYGWESLQKLWNREISLVYTVDGNEWYTRDEVRNILVELMTSFQPATVRTQDWTTNPNNLDDHSDHLATAEFARLANQSYTSPHTLLAYKGYPILAYPQNVTGPDLRKSVAAFVTFAGYDMNVCNNPAEGCPDYPHDAWLEREYLVQSESTKNAARETGVTVTASSAISTTQSAEKARDGFPSGEPQAADTEWVSNGQGAGAWIQYNFPAPTPIEGVTLFDRPGLDQQIADGTLEFSDGTSVPVGTLPNNGSGHSINFPVHTVTSIRLNITAVSATTTNAGIAEFEAWRGPADTTAPTVTVSPASGAYPAGQQITLTANEPATIYYTTDGSEPT